MTAPILPQLGGGWPSGSESSAAGAVEGAPLTLLGGIVNRFAGSSLLVAAVPEGQWSTKLPDNLETYPFVWVEHLGMEPEWNSEQEVLEKTEVRFEFYDAGVEEVEALALLIMNRFDWGVGYDLNVVNQATIDVSRGRLTIRSTGKRDQDGQDVAVGSLNYTFLMKRNPRFDTE